MSVIRHFIAAIIKISKETATRSSFKRFAIVDSTLKGFCVQNNSFLGREQALTLYGIHYRLMVEYFIDYCSSFKKLIILHYKDTFN